MTTSNLMSLPIDIKWKRLCFSEDMVDQKTCDKKHPPKWRSSLSAFYFEPEKDQQPYSDQIITYLKISCTVTNFSPSAREVGLTPDNLKSYWSKPEQINKLTQPKTYPSYGALLQVVVGPPPEDDNISIDKYPYIMDFEPKKREIYETATDSKETLSRSLSNINVKKGLTSTETNEQLDIFTGAGLEFAYKGAKISGNMQGQFGTREISQRGSTNINTTDNSKERRETISYTTTLSQMYHQFMSYHLGTNRAVFLMLPRPHTKTSDLTFINGPVQLQGIQDIFLIISRPKTMRWFCLEAYLETAHLVTDVKDVEIKREELWTHENFVEAKNKQYMDTLANVDYSKVVTSSEEYTPPHGFKIDTSKGSGGYGAKKGFDILKEDKNTTLQSVDMTASGDKIQVVSRVKWRFWETGANKNNFEDGDYSLTLRIFLIKKQKQLKSSMLWITGRGICCCPNRILYINPKGKPGLSDWVVSEIPPQLIDDSDKAPGPFEIGAATKENILKNNSIIRYIGDTMIRSIGSSTRYPIGAVSFYETDFFTKSISESIQTRDSDNLPISKIAGIDDIVRNKVIEAVGDIKRKDLLSLPFRELCSQCGISEEKARYLKAAAIGISE